MSGSGTSHLQALGQAIQDRRTRLRLSQKELAAEAGIDRAYISNIEQGKRNPSFIALITLARGLDMRLSRLLAKAERISESQ